LALAESSIQLIQPPEPTSNVLVPNGKFALMITKSPFETGLNTRLDSSAAHGITNDYISDGAAPGITLNINIDRL